MNNKIHKTTIEMVIGSVEDFNGFIKINYFVKLSTEDGKYILYPWESLKKK